MIRIDPRTCVRTLALPVLMLGLLAASVPCGAQERAHPVHQLRIYEIFEHNKQAFHQRFRDHAARIMARHEFKVVAMWEARTADRTEFVYLLEWPDERTMKERWARFMEDEEWSRIKRETGALHGALVGNIEERTMTLTDYSPAGLSRRAP